jgi:hypothetical protein
MDCSFTRSIGAPHDGARGGPCDDPASLVVLAVAAKVAQDVDEARCCGDLHQPDQGCRDRELAGLHHAIPGEEDRSHFRSRVGAEAIETTMTAVVDLFDTVGLIKGERLSTDGQLEPSPARYTGCTSAGAGCRSFRVDATGQPDLCRQLSSGATRLQLTCPLPEVVDKVRQATATQGSPQDPQVALLEIEDIPDGQASGPDRQQVATRLGRPADAVPAVRLPWCHLTPGPQGALLGSGPKVPSDREANVGDHIDTTDPTQTARVLGSLHQKTPDSNRELGLE